MRQNVQKSKTTNIILLTALLAIVLLLATPLLFLSYSSKGVGTQVIWGWPGIFGGSAAYYEGTTLFRSVTFDMNWQLYLTLLVIFVMAVTTYLIGPKSRGYYVFAGIVLLVASLNIFLTKNWLNQTLHFSSGNATYDWSVSHLGVGPWAGGLLTLVSALACFFEYSTTKKASTTYKPAAKKY